MSDSQLTPVLPRTGGLAAWSIRHPIGVTMITLALVVLGFLFSLQLPIDLMPNIVYPEVRVRVINPGVPARIMEDQVTRQLEEQLAITENVISITSRSRDGESAVDMSFPYGTDIEIALRDASNRLDRAMRFLPEGIEPPLIFKIDPQQIPVAEFVVSSEQLSAVQLRSFVDYTFSKWFINLPGVASTEVGGGLVREIQVLPDLERLAAIGLSSDDLVKMIREANRDIPAGRLRAPQHEYISRTSGRFQTVEELRRLPITVPGGNSVPLSELAEVRDTHEEERLRVRFDTTSGIKLTIQKQPSANTIAVVEAVMQRLQWLKDNQHIPADIQIHQVSDQSVYVRQALNNATLAGLSGATLAMLVVLLFLGDIRRTLVIGSAIPIAIALTLFVMEFTGLTLNIMSLGGLAVGIGMLVDSSIVMLENIHRHQQQGDAPQQAAVLAAQEVNSAIVASTSTNLAAVLPFLLIGGLSGLLFRELIITVSAAIFAAMLVALTLVPAWSTRLRNGSPGNSKAAPRRWIDHGLQALQRVYARRLSWLLQHRSAQAFVALALIALLGLSLPKFLGGNQVFLPDMDDGRIGVRVTGDPGTSMETMDQLAKRLEALYRAQPEVESVFTITGGFIFGRTQREASSRATLEVQLKPITQRAITSNAWIERMNREIADMQLVGYNVRMRTRGLRGLRLSAGEEELTLRIQGPELEVLHELGSRVTALLETIPGLRNPWWSGEEIQHELALQVDRERAAQLGLSVEDIGNALHFALEGEIAGDYLDGDRNFDIRIKLPIPQLRSISDIENLVLFGTDNRRQPVRLSEVGKIRLIATPNEILRDQQQRMIEINASLSGDIALNKVMETVRQQLDEIEIPAGYRLYDVGTFKSLQQGRDLAGTLLGLALFLVFVVMAVQYESLRNPFIILLSVPFAAAGPALALPLLEAPLSMPVWLGLIMLAGIVVNNAIVLVEYIEILREQGLAMRDAISQAGALRLRPILMTTLTTVCGLLPLSLGWGEGSEMLQPLAQTIVFGLSFSLLVSLALVPILYLWLHPAQSSR